MRTRPLTASLKSSSLRLVVVDRTLIRKAQSSSFDRGVSDPLQVDELVECMRVRFGAVAPLFDDLSAWES